MERSAHRSIANRNRNKDRVGEKKKGQQVIYRGSLKKFVERCESSGG